jgi:hypothetical protein
MLLDDSSLVLCSVCLELDSMVEGVEREVFLLGMVLGFAL